MTRPSSMRLSKRFLLTIALSAAISLAVISVLYPYRNPVPEQSDGMDSYRVITFADKKIRVTVATTPAERQQGLSGRKNLAPDEGMLFVFPKEGEYAFWMKDMQFPIDILWFSKDFKVVYIQAHLTPETYPTSFSPSSPAQYVLEVPSGYTQTHGVKVGDLMKF